MVVHELYTPPLRGIWTNDGLVAYAVGEANTVRATTNGGLSWQVVPVNGLRTTLRGVQGNATGTVLAVGNTISTGNRQVLALSGTTYAAQTLSGGNASDVLNAVAVSGTGAVVVAAANAGGTAGGAYRRTPNGTWSHSAYSQPVLAVWSFPNYMADAPAIFNETSHEDFLIGGQAGHMGYVRYVPGTNSFPSTPSGWGAASGIAGNVRAFWFHDQVNGFAVVNNSTGSQLYRVVLPLNRANTGTWSNGTTPLTLANEADAAPLCIAFADRERGFVGGSQSTTPVGLARTLTDEGGLYSQRFWYDALGRLVLSQNSKQFNMATQRFSYSLYDALGRVYEAGELEDDGNAPDRFQDLPATNVNGALLPNVLDPEVLKAWVLNRPRYEVTRTYYDDIFPSLSIPGFAQVNLRLRVASTVYYESEYAQPTPNEANYDHATHYSYDIHGNVKTLVQDHPQLGRDACPPAPAPCTGYISQRYKRMDYTYDLISGNVRQVDYQKDQPDALHHRYTYDADNRITEVETSADAQNWHTDARYFYYPHGPLQRVELGEHLVQGTDYAYTLQGWLKGINGDRLNPTTDMGRDGDATVVGNPNLLTGRDAYALSLGYYGDADYKAIASSWDDNTPANVVQRPFAPIGTSGTLNTEHTPLYNGNIAHTVNTLQHFGLWDATNGDQGQVLAMVYRYDQLNRLRKARGVIGLASTNTWNGVADSGPNEDNRYRSEYEYDANGNILAANRWDYEGDHYDEFAYKYQRQSGTARLLRNRLYQLFDEADPTNLHANTSPDGSEDIGFLPETTTFDEQAAELNGLHNYHYDALGNLIHDEREQIDVIEWTVAGKVKSVSRTLGSTRDPLSFGYGASGQRVLKQVGTNPDGGNGYREHYIRDAQGNIMATYRYTVVPVPNTTPQDYTASLKLNERQLYGSSRLGSLRTEVELHTLAAFDPASANPVQMVDLNYELTDHLGNVCAVVTGRLLDGNGGGTAKQAELVSAQGYEPFGSLLPGRNYSISSYTYGFNGQEMLDEVNDSKGISYDFGARLYDSRIGRWFSIDPKAEKYPAASPYHFAFNNPIAFIDFGGMDGRLKVVRDAQGGGTITLETTVHLYGPDATDEMAVEMNQKFACLGNTATYTDPSTGEVWNVTINVTFVNNSVLTEQHKTMGLPSDGFASKPAWLPEGDNVLFVNRNTPTDAMAGGLGGHAKGDAGAVRDSRFFVVMHETGHFLGYDERYNLGGLCSLPGDIMATHGGGEEIAPVHFGDLARYALTMSANGIIESPRQIEGRCELESSGYRPTAISCEELMNSGADPTVSAIRKEVR